MNVTCTGCPAKYAVPDEKVRGKKVRITCKHCGTNIVVDGTADANDGVLPKPAAKVALASAPGHGTAPAEAPGSVLVKPPTAAVAEVMFIVGFPDDRQHAHTVSQIVAMYSAGQIDDEALVWKDGMADWLSPFDVPELAAAFRAKNVAPRAGSPALSPMVEEEATLVVRSPLDDPEVAAAIAAAKAPAAVAAPTPAAPTPAAPTPAAPTPAAPTPAAPTPVAVAAPDAAADAAPGPAPVATGAGAMKPAEEPMFGRSAAARRVEKRADSVDLFGNLADAGSEGDVSLDLGSSEEPAHKLTGARNESSVLFSLDALTKSDSKATKAKEKEKEREKEEASAVLFGETAPDSLMNLGSGGLGAMAAPDFTKPVSAVAQTVPLSNPLQVPDAPANKGRGGVVLLVGFFAIAAAAAVAFVMMKKLPTTDPASIAPSATMQMSASPAPSSLEAPAPSAAPDASAASTASTASAGSSAPTAGAAAPTAGAAAAAGSQATTVAVAGSAKAATPAVAATPATPAVVNQPAEPAAAAKPPEAASPPDGAAFDKNAAVAALGSAAASAGSCKRADGPTGSGKVSVTFAPSGRATATSVAGELAGTEVGGCVARLFRSAKVPPFTGDPVTVSKSFTIQ